MRTVLLVVLVAHIQLGQPVEESKEPKKAVSYEHRNLKEVVQVEATTAYSISYRFNEVETIAEHAFMFVTGLQELDLSHNSLAGEVIRPDVFRGAFSNKRYEPLGLVVLDLGYNQIHSVGAKSFEHLPDLLELRLNNNPLLVIDGPTEIALSRPPLTILNLGYAQLSNLPESFVISLKTLKEFYLNGNNFKTVPNLSFLGNSLQKLNLNDIPIEDLNNSSFTGLRNLEELNVSACSQLKAILSTTFAPCTALKRLYLSSNARLSLIAKDAFYLDINDWPIEELYLNNDSLSEMSNGTIQWSNLQVLDLQDNPWKCDCQLEWMVSGPIPTIAKTDLDRVVAIKCDSPPEKKNVQLFSLRSELAKSCGGNKLGYSFDGHFHPFILVLAGMSLVVCIAAVIVFGRQQCQKHHRFQLLSDVKYSRFDEEEELYSRT